jgi:putative ABC transport system substrate-binding protein
LKRREFITLFCGRAAIWPLAARAQQAKIPIVRFLNAGSPDGYTPYVTGFLRGLAEAGYVEGKNVAVDYRWARGQYDHLQAMAGDLVRLNVAVIAANTPAAPVAKAATAEIPIVFVSTGDPVIAGLVASFNRPQGNVTGVSLLGPDFGR